MGPWPRKADRRGRGGGREARAETRGGRKEGGHYFHAQVPRTPPATALDSSVLPGLPFMRLAGVRWGPGGRAGPGIRCRIAAQQWARCLRVSPDSARPCCQAWVHRSPPVGAHNGSWQETGAPTRTASDARRHDGTKGCTAGSNAALAPGPAGFFGSAHVVVGYMHTRKSAQSSLQGLRLLTRPRAQAMGAAPRECSREHSRTRAGGLTECPRFVPNSCRPNNGDQSPEMACLHECPPGGRARCAPGVGIMTDVRTAAAESRSSREVTSGLARRSAPWARRLAGMHTSEDRSGWQGADRRHRVASSSPCRSHLNADSGRTRSGRTRHRR